MQADYTHISFLLDRSGSMERVASDTIGGFNSFVATQKGGPGRATFTLAQFDDVYEIVGSPMSNIAYVRDLTPQTFVPRGSTALLDAIGRLIDETGAALSRMPEEARPGKVVFVIQTDGEENASKRFDATQVNSMITRQRDTYRWQFVFLGANQDAITSASRIGISRHSTMTYAANTAGTAGAYASLGNKVAAFRCATANADALHFDAQDWATQASAGVTLPKDQIPTSDSKPNSKADV
jgi:hypothetical protein